MAYNRFDIFNELELWLLEIAINNLLVEEENHELPLVDRAAASLTKLLEEVQSANA